MNIYGRACWVGISGTVVTAELSTVGKLEPTNITFDRETPGSEMADGRGNTFGEFFGDARDSAVITAIVTDPSNTPTKTGVKANMKLPGAGSIVTLAATGGGALLDGDWNCGRKPVIVPASATAWLVTIPITRKGPPAPGSTIPTALQLVAD
jgi:hypothetical protein